MTLVYRRRLSARQHCRKHIHMTGTLLWEAYEHMRLKSCIESVSGCDSSIRSLGYDNNVIYI